MIFKKKIWKWIEVVGLILTFCSAVVYTYGVNWWELQFDEMRYYEILRVERANLRALYEIVPVLYEPQEKRTQEDMNKLKNQIFNDMIRTDKEFKMHQDMVEKGQYATFSYICNNLMLWGAILALLAKVLECKAKE